MGLEFGFSEFYNIVDGSLATTEKTRQSINPSTLEPNPSVPVSTRVDVERAVDSATRALKTWSAVSVEDRRKAIVAFATALEEQSQAFGIMLTKEQGRPLPLAVFEVQTAAQWLKQIANLPFEQEVTETRPDKTIITRYTPLGVVCGIVPWNFPVTLACGKIAPALLTGNTFIMKPSPSTPYCGLKLCELAQPFFPPGVFQCLSGDDDLGPYLTEHPGIHKISFTGSIATGRKVMETCSKTLKRITLELGGNDAAVVCPDVDIATVAPAMAQLTWFNSGQVCVAVKRIYVHESIYSEFLNAFVAVTKALVVGDGFAEDTMLGPVSNLLQYNCINEHLDDIKTNKYTVATGGRPSSSELGDVKGFFIEPTVVDNPPDQSRIVLEEPFGPIIPLLKWTDEHEMIQRVNSTNFGLGASVWSKDKDEATRIAKQIQAGTVWINSHMALDPTVPHGGYKDSGIGLEYGLDGLKAYCNTQSIHL